MSNSGFIPKIICRSTRTATTGKQFAIVELRVDGSVALANRKDRIIPYDAKATDVKKILSAAAENFDRIKAAWEKMHR